MGGIRAGGLLRARKRDDAAAESGEAVWRGFQEEAPKLRDALEEEFRAALGNNRAKLWARRRRREGLKLLERPAIESPQSDENPP
jgi:hypothetical protein